MQLLQQYMYDVILNYVWSLLLSDIITRKLRGIYVFIFFFFLLHPIGWYLPTSVLFKTMFIYMFPNLDIFFTLLITTL